MATENNDNNQDEANYEKLKLAQLHMEAAHVINRAKRRMFERSREGTPLGKAAETFHHEVTAGLLELIPGSMYADLRDQGATQGQTAELTVDNCGCSADCPHGNIVVVIPKSSQAAQDDDTQDEIDILETLGLDWPSIDKLANEFVDDSDLNLTLALLRRLQKLEDANDAKTDFRGYVSLLIARMFRATEYCEAIAGHYADTQDGTLRRKGGAA